MEALTERPACLALGINLSVRDEVSVKEVIQEAAITRASRGQDAQPGDFTVALQTLPPHNERPHDWFTYSRQFRQRLPQAPSGNFQHFSLIRFPSSIGQCRSSHEHRYIPDKVARSGGCEDLLLAIA